MRSNTVPVKPQQLHYPPAGGRGRGRGGGGGADKEGASENKCNENRLQMRNSEHC